MAEDFIEVWFTEEELDAIDQAVALYTSAGWPIRTREEFMSFAVKRGALEIAALFGIDVSKFCDC